MEKSNINKYEFKDLFDIEEVQKLTDAISETLEIGIIIVDPNGEDITKPSNFCNFCNNVVRSTEQGRLYCRKSDVELGKVSDKPITSRCMSAGLMDAGISIVIDGKHFASWMLGQVVIEGEELSEEEARERARTLNIDEEVFLENLKKVPRKTRTEFERIINMIHIIAMQLTQLGLKSYIQKEELEQKRSLEDNLRAKMEYLENYNKHDDLTGVYNRSYFEGKLAELCKQDVYPIVYISGDCNNLKLANDVFGHQYGDLMLKVIGRILLENAKPEYIIGRCGGDEFNIVIPNGTVEEANEYCERIHESCKEITECIIPPSISLGVGVITSPEADRNEVIKEAEEIMYSVKRAKKKNQNIHTDIMELLYRREFVLRDQVEENVKRIFKFGYYLSLDEHTISVLRMCAELQNVGLIAVPEEIVKNKNRTPEEHQEFLKHTETGHRLAKLYNESFPAAEIILQSQENWNGSGYPNQLVGNKILYTARIHRIVSAYSYWIYKAPTGLGMSIPDARERLRRQSGNEFDPDFVQQFLEYLKRYEPIN